MQLYLITPTTCEPSTEVVPDRGSLVSSSGSGRSTGSTSYIPFPPSSLLRARWWDVYRGWSDEEGCEVLKRVLLGMGGEELIWYGMIGRVGGMMGRMVHG